MRGSGIGTDTLRAALIGVAVFACGTPGADAADRSAKRTIELALVGLTFAMHQTEDGKQECPEGLHHSNKDNWKAQFPTEEERTAFSAERVHLAPRSGAGGNLPENYLQARGPQGQHVAYSPEIFKDLPLREVQSKVAYGLNLDGTLDGRATAKTCKHVKFAGVDGKPAAIDNQLYRVLGCAVTWRKHGAISERRTIEARTQVLNRMLYEISDVDDDRNDPEVWLTTYKGIDRIDIDAAGKPLTTTQQRIDVRYPKYTVRVKGKIVDGVVITEPADLYMPLFQTQTETERFMRDGRFHLKLTPTGAEGMLAGYENLKQFWLSYASSYARQCDLLGKWDPPAMYEALHRLADGYPDAETGQCTAISAAWRVTMVHADIVSPRADDPLVTDASFKAAQRTVQQAQNADGS